MKDRLKGNPVKKHYNEIKFIIENYSDNQASQIRDMNLSGILCHAINSTPFYSNVKSPFISDFPVINKNIVRENDNAFRSSNKKYSSKCCYYTSGSTGAPFSVHVNKSKRDRTTADTIYFGELAGYKLGDRLFYFKIWSQLNKKGKLLGLAQNIVPIDVLNLNDRSIAEIIERLKRDKSSKAILAYASLLDALCSYLERSDSVPIFKNTKAAIAQAETLCAATKEGISYYFNTQAVSRYSNNENGIIAQQIGKDNEFIINEASFFVEILEMDSDTPVPDGTPGRIVITDLFNYCSPLIRYDTGDIGVLGKKEVMGHSRKVFESVEGRKLDIIFDTKGSIVSSYLWFKNMWKYKEIRQFQIIQHEVKEYLLKINVKNHFEKEAQIIEEYKDLLGEDAIIKVEYVEDIPLLDSGKRKTTLNLLRKTG